MKTGSAKEWTSPWPVLPGAGSFFRDDSDPDDSKDRQAAKAVFFHFRRECEKKGINPKKGAFIGRYCVGTMITYGVVPCMNAWMGKELERRIGFMKALSKVEEEQNEENDGGPAHAGPYSVPAAGGQSYSL
ncbi:MULTISPECIES: hypothetical protein [Paenibacillus]|uniref:hypothetical protein n=1 Tax=Paenibacillus TaxID=44249 RepID=UPI000FD9F489|nr:MULTISPECIES: hypothetical protein [Paenibacillus]